MGLSIGIKRTFAGVKGPKGFSHSAPLELDEARVAAPQPADQCKGRYGDFEKCFPTHANKAWTYLMY